MRFLIIDDSSVDRHSLVTLLELLGHEVDQCSTTLEALPKVESGNYDLVFLDIVMPEQDGYKFLRSLRLNPKTSSQYVVFCSSKNTKLEMDYGIKRGGANDYLPKPVTRESLEQTIDRLVSAA